MVRHCSGDAVGLLVSEFIAAEGLTRDNAKTCAMLRFAEPSGRFRSRSSAPTSTAWCVAARMVEETGADIVDINCGCPAPEGRQARRRRAALREPEHLAASCVAVRRGASASR